METGVKQIWVITDGRAGNVAQARGVAEAVARQVPAEIVARVVTLRPAFRRLPQVALSLPVGAWPFLALTDRHALDGVEAADLVISAGRRGAVFAAAIRRLHRVPSVAILNPQMALPRFDAVVAPAHDRLVGPNVIETIGAPNPLTPEVVTAAAAELSKDWRPAPPRLAVIIGGPSRSARFDQTSVKRLLEDIAGFEAAGWSILSVTSRRTPDFVAPMLRRRFPEAQIWAQDGPNPYPGVLGVADAAMVTEDSVNMASEAATAGLPIFISGLDRIDEKFRRFHAGLAVRGCTRPAADGPVNWSYEPLREADRVAGLLVERIFTADPKWEMGRQTGLPYN